ncbi:unnamed protein product [Rangifer tarandus platyrhynchus]|uniref:Uncharacterized protein n=1 Tax=Rangifer tarandus platyrhynchus TaxID=3082113 RepID=A0ABN8Y6X0_RANTA|nr:unnamed protein product [Rangifer tarandus platyrhynchus]
MDRRRGRGPPKDPEPEWKKDSDIRAQEAPLTGAGRKHRAGDPRRGCTGGPWRVHADHLADVLPPLLGPGGSAVCCPCWTAPAALHNASKLEGADGESTGSSGKAAHAPAPSLTSRLLLIPDDGREARGRQEGPGTISPGQAEKGPMRTGGGPAGLAPGQPARLSSRRKGQKHSCEAWPPNPGSSLCFRGALCPQPRAEEPRERKPFGYKGGMSDPGQVDEEGFSWGFSEDSHTPSPRS